MKALVLLTKNNEILQINLLKYLALHSTMCYTVLGGEYMDDFEWLTQLRRGIMEFCVLQLIHKKACYGYEIVSNLESFQYLAITEGTLYPLLRRLQKEKKLEAYWLESENGPPRKYYTLTALGLELLNKMSQTWVGISKEINNLL